MTDRIIPSDFVRRSVELSHREGSVDLTPAVRAAGITPEEMADPLYRLTPSQVTAFVQATWQITDDELFGLAPAPVPRGTFRMVCLTLIHTPDLGSALERMSDVLRALPTLAPLRIERGSATTRVSIELRDASERPSDETRVITDFLLILLHRFAAWLVGKRVRLLAVDLPYPQPSQAMLAENYDHIFGVPVTFGADVPALEIDNAVLRAPIIQTEESLEEYLRESPTLLLSERDYDSTASAQVRRVLELGVKGRTSTAEEIASMLSISVPHLRRLLRQDGTSLNQLREEVLRDAAIAGLRRGESVDELSGRLGFSEPSAFRRAFKRWTGSTPSTYR
ncbi:AraC family transcriptional regulator [Rhodococcus triatomae]|uniref:Helix-turn-helix domain-containing protein n=1 Tax=Rhodococcus triatomae TaxID=300028 RepID=A0A1G8AXR3_9NOCA|nr:AraC family transcriptional regulator [Rhodococcus triatomae]QNG17655.1 AraC family transcriptional regulator [Rhodococcus triatomae]QNG22678.1 AraC family transcriptional regulator [Rhodococcus triatomae]SDH25160.1 Helix-turn-helix domain-containing protein [Rhodococcus triatomae]